MDYDWVMACGDEKFPVNARLLHGALGSRQDFSTWIKVRITGGKFVENADYKLLHGSVEHPSGGGSNRIDYHLTTRMSKHLCQSEQTQKGMEVRDYFIIRDQRLTRVDAGAELPTSMAGIKVPTTLIEAMELAITTLKKNAALTKEVDAFAEYTGQQAHEIGKLTEHTVQQAETIVDLSAEVEKAAPAVAWVNLVSDSPGLLTFTDVAKPLGVGANALLMFLWASKIIYKM